MLELLTVQMFAQAPDPLGDLIDTAGEIPYGQWIAIGLFVIVGVYLIASGIRGRRKPETPRWPRGGWLQIGLGAFFLIVAAVIAFYSFLNAVIVVGLAM
jgi:hypothetical protein